VSVCRASHRRAMALVSECTPTPATDGNLAHGPAVMGVFMTKRLVERLAVQWSADGAARHSGRLRRCGATAMKTRDGAVVEIWQVCLYRPEVLWKRRPR